jgi:hypothetical protein
MIEIHPQSTKSGWFVHFTRIEEKHFSRDQMEDAIL